MKHLGKILAFLSAAGALLALTVLLCRRKRRHKRSRYTTLYQYDT